MNGCGTKCGGKPHKIKRHPKPILEDEGDFYLIEPEYPSHQTFTITPQLGDPYRGIFYADDKQSYIHCGRHEVIEDIISTAEHEALHAAIWQCIEWEFEDMWNNDLIEKWSIKTNDRKEHNAIRIMLMEQEYFSE